MAQVGVAIVGGLLGSFVGMPQLGFMVGGMIGGLIFGSGAGEGPRLTDLKVTSSAYGSDIPIVHGTARLTGNMIWATDIEEKSSGGGKGGALGGGPTTYVYYGNFAIAFCEGPVSNLLKVWADGTLIYDITGDSDKPSKKGKKAKKTVKNSKYKFRFYNGTEDQMPDSLIKTKVEAIHGADSCPAYRGMCYIVYDHINLKKFGNRIPNLSVLVSTSSTVISTGTQAASTGSTAPLTSVGGLAADWNKRVLYAISTGITSGTNYLASVNPETMATIASNYYPAVLDASETLGTYFTCIGTGMSGNIYAALKCVTNFNRIIKINPDTMKQVTPGFGIVDPGVSPSDTRHYTFNFRNVTSLFEVKVAGGTSGVEYFVCAVNTGGFPAILRASNMTYVWGGYKTAANVLMTDYPTMTYAWGSCINFTVAGRQSTGSSDICIANGSTGYTGTSIELFTLTLSAGAAYTSGTASTGVSFSHAGTIKVANFDPDYILQHPSNNKIELLAFTYDSQDDTYIVHVKYKPSSKFEYKMLKFSTSNGVLWQKSIDNPFLTLGAYDNTIDGQLGWVDGGAKPYNLADLTAGTLVYNNVGPDTPTGIKTGMGAIALQFYDGASTSIYFVKSGLLYRVPFGVVNAESKELTNIIRDICHRSGLTDDQIDIDDLPSNPVYGYTISRNSTGKELLTQLSGIYFFDAGEIDYKLVFRSKGQDAIASIPQIDMGSMGRPEDGDYWVPKRQQEQDLPKEIDIKYFDINSDYQDGMQNNTRNTYPWNTTYSLNKVTIEAPIAMGSDQARQISQKTLFTAYIERESGSLKLPWRYIYLDPTDVVTLQLEGLTQDYRIVKAAMGADFTLQLDLVAQDIVSYSSLIEGEDTGTGVSTEVGTTSTGSMMFFNTPLLRDTDDTGGLYGRRYYAVLQNDLGWPGAVVYQSTDAVVYNQYDDSLTLTPKWGTALTILGTTTMPFSTDLVNTVQILFKNWVEDPSTVTTEEMLAGKNALLLGNEIIQFKTVTVNDDGSVTLSELLRGRRGSEWAVGTHVSGEKAIILDTSSIDTKTIALSERNALRYYRAVRDGDFLDSTETISDTYLGRDLMPYAPVNFKATIVSTDVVLTFSRRSRVAGELTDGIGDVALGEASESYEVYILAAPYNSSTFDATNSATYLHKYTVTTPSAIYTAAHMTADTHTITGIVYGVAFQISATVGRGFPGPFFSVP